MSSIDPEVGADRKWSKTIVERLGSHVKLLLAAGKPFNSQTKAFKMVFYTRWNMGRCRMTSTDLKTHLHVLLMFVNILRSQSMLLLDGVCLMEEVLRQERIGLVSLILLIAVLKVVDKSCFSEMLSYCRQKELEPEITIRIVQLSLRNL